MLLLVLICQQSKYTQWLGLLEVFLVGCVTMDNGILISFSRSGVETVITPNWKSCLLCQHFFFFFSSQSEINLTPLSLSLSLFLLSHEGTVGLLLFQYTSVPHTIACI